MIEKDVTSFTFNVFNTVFRNIGHLDQVRVRLLGKSLDLAFFIGTQVSVFLDVDLGENDDEWLCLEERFDGVEQVDLLWNSIPT